MSWMDPRPRIPLDKFHGHGSYLRNIGSQVLSCMPFYVLFVDCCVKYVLYTKPVLISQKQWKHQENVWNLLKVHVFPVKKIFIRKSSSKAPKP